MYVDVQSCTVYEHFLTYIKAESLDAASLSSYILCTLHEHGLDTKWLVSQGYDGASVMSSKHAGVQQRIKDVAQAIYIHCYAHCLHFVLVDCAKGISEADEFFQLLQTLYVFISTSKAHEIYISKQSQLYPDKQVRQMKRLSDTRWACRYAAVDTVCCTYDSMLVMLETIVDGDDKCKAVEANGILLQVHTFKFLFLLVVFTRILSCTKRLSDQLQCKDTDMAKAAELVSATIETLTDFRSENRWDQVFKYTTEVAELYSIEVSSSSRPRRTRVTPKRLEDDIILETAGVRDDTSTSDQLKVSIYLPIIDTMLYELNRRFANQNLDLM